MRREASRVSFLMCPFCVRAALPGLTPLCALAALRAPEGRSCAVRQSRRRGCGVLTAGRSSG